MLDSGTTGHFFLCSGPLKEVRLATNPITCSLPIGSTMTSTLEGQLDLGDCDLPPEALAAHVFPDLKLSLLSIGLFCDHGCEAYLDAMDAYITKNGKVILHGKRHDNGLWIFDLATVHQLPSPPTAFTHISAMTMESTTMADHIQFLHAAAFSPVLSTFLQAIRNGHYATWPGLTVENVRRYLPKSTATVKGHLDQTRKNQRSTKPKVTIEDTDEHDIVAHPPITDGKRTHFVYAAIVDAPNESGRVYTDQTGKFPVTSRKGSKYIMVLYDYDSNAILTEPMTSKTGPEMIRAYTKLHDRLVASGLKPRLQWLDNEASAGLKQFLNEQDIKFQLVPPAMHRRNAAERAIRTFKNHLIAGLCSTDENFPMSLWDRLLKQAELMINLLRASRINPKLSAYAQLEGSFDFNATPMAPPGTRIVVHEKPSTRATWAPHGKDGWYVGPAMEHYRCFTAHVNATNSERVSDTVEFFPRHCRNACNVLRRCSYASRQRTYSCLAASAPSNTI